MKFQKGQIAWNKGKHHSIETRRKMSETLKGRKLSEEHKRKISKNHARHNFGKHHSEETIKKISDSQKGNKYKFGKHPSEETRRKLSESHKGKLHSEEQKRKIGEAHKGEKSHLWKGGISFLPYSVDWTRTLRRSIRERDHYTCQLCGKLQSDEAFSIHHIDYDKKNCDPHNLITVCHSCHSKTNFNIEYWKERFTKLIKG